MAQGEGHMGYEPAGRAESFWMASTPGTNFPELAEGVRVDVAVLGGGIAGITTALLLKEAGLSVAVVEAKRIVSGVTGYTTAKLTSLHRAIYRNITNSLGKERAQAYADANQAAIEMVASLVAKHTISCDFTRRPAYTFAEREEDVRILRDEVSTAKDLGLPATFETSLPLPFKTYGAACFANQAQFHPRKYLLALMDKIPGEGSYIFEQTRAINIREGEPATVVTDKGNLRAQDVVVATHFPFYDKPNTYFSKLHQSRSYVVAIRPDEPFPEGMFINTQGSARSLRSTPADDGELVLVSGAEHKAGQESSTRDHYRTLEAYAKRIDPKSTVAYHWSTQDTITVDGLPYVGPLASGHPHIYVATGFGKWGMTNGTAAGMILSDMILGRSNPWVAAYDPLRFTPLTSAKDFLAQNLNVAGQFITGKVARPHEGVAGLEPGEGGIVEVDREKVAAYRDSRGIVHRLDPTCMHMGCTVAWNDAERSWDCPCHGSRYNAEGDVIQGPTVKGLKKLPEQK